jgi:hypothetical protein
MLRSSSVAADALGVHQMADVTNTPERKLRLKHIANFKTGNVPNIDEVRPVVDDPARPHRSAPWPFKAENGSPLTWWRQLPSDAFRDDERLLLLATLRRISVMHGGDDLAAAMRGDVAAAIGAALDLMPIEKITLQVDITLTALMRTALDGDAASSLVMAQIVGLIDVGHEFSAELAASWLVHGERHSKEPDKFREARITLLTALKDHRNEGEDA